MSKTTNRATNLPFHLISFYVKLLIFQSKFWEWSGGATVLGKLLVPGRPTIWVTVEQGPTVLAVGSGGGCLDIFTLIYPFSPLLPLFGKQPDID